MTNIMNETWDITIEPADIKRIIRKYKKQVHTHNFDKLNEMDQFLEKHKPKPNT